MDLLFHLFALYDISNITDFLYDPITQEHINNMFIFVVLAVSSHGTTTSYDGSRRSTVEFTCYTCRPITYGGPI